MPALEKLHRTLVLFRCVARVERAQVPALARLRIEFSRIEPVFTRLEFANHGTPLALSNERALRSHARARRLAGAGAALLRAPLAHALASTGAALRRGSFPGRC